MTLVEFLTARYDEAAKLASGEPLRSSKPSDYAMHGLEVSGEYMCLYVDPPTVLRDIDAKRKILAHHREYPFTDVDQGIRASPACAVCCGSFNEAELDDDWRSVRDGTLHVNPAVYPCWTVRLLAEPYDQHPDYNPEWRTNA